MVKTGLRALTCVLIFGLGLWAQTTGGSISGNVTDTSGASIPGVAVTATNTATGIVNRTQSNAVGAYNFPALPIGSYTLTATRTGFQTYKQTGITVSVHESLRQDLKMQVGEQTQTVEVSATAAHVNTSTTQMGDVVAGSSITAQPLNGRSYTDLLGLQPGVNPPSTNNSDPGTVSISGSRTDANGFTVNGGSVEEGVNNGTSIIPDLDSIAEFRVITNGADAEYGHFSGGQVSVVTKSGTNQFHGDLFEFFRNQGLDANDYFNNLNGVGKGTYRRNQFGGTLGGPILHNKLFFFGDYQGTRITQGVVQQVNVPTADEWSGNLDDRASHFYNTITDNQGNVTGYTPINSVSSPFLASKLTTQFGYPVASGEPYYFPGCTAYTGGTLGASNCVFPGPANQLGPRIPKTDWASPVTAFEALVPAPNGTRGGRPAFVTSAGNQTEPDNKGSARIDYSSPWGMLSGYYFIDNSNNLNPYGNASLPGYSTETPARAQQFNVGLTTILGPDAVNEAHLNFVRAYHIQGIAIGGVGPKISSFGFDNPASCTGGNFTNCDGLITSDPAMEGVPYVSTNDWSVGTQIGGTTQANNTYEGTENFSLTHGNHQIKFGGQVEYAQINERNVYGSNGQFQFNGTETGDDFADFLIGASDGYTQASHQVLDSRAWYYGWYAQDTWRMTPSLTLNYGLRWEVSTFYYDTQNKIQTYEQGVNSAQYPGAPTGFVFPGDPNIPRTLAPTGYKNFAPRLGLAWSPSASGGLGGLLFGPSGHSSIRAAWGMYYTDVADSALFVEVADAPFGLYWSTSNVFFAQPWLQTNGTDFGQHFPFTLPTPGDANINWSTYEPISYSPGIYYKDQLPYTENYNFSYERQLGSNTVMDLAFVGSQGHRLLVAVPVNPGNPGLCSTLSDPTNLAAGATACGPNNENLVYPLSAAGQSALSTTATAINGTRAPYGIQFASTNLSMDTMGNSTYNSLQASVRHTAGRLTYLLGYTYGKAMDTASSGQFGGIIDPYNYSLTHSLSNFDITQNFVASYNYELPFDKLFGGNGFSRDWRIAGTTRLTTGSPVGMSYGTDNSYIGDGIDFPQWTATGHGQKLQFNNPRQNTLWLQNGPSMFTDEPAGQLGNVNRAFFHGPGIINTDLTLMKGIPLGEERRIELRFDAFNVFNHVQFSNPDGNESNGDFLQITSDNGARIAQMAVKFIF